MTYTIDILIALQKGERLSKAWWARRYHHGSLRAGGMPPEVADPGQVVLKRQEDPDSGERFACVTFLLPAATSLSRVNELSHMLTSVLEAEGFTIRTDGRRLEPIAAEYDGTVEGTYGEPTYTEGRVCSNRCLTCALASETLLACCGEGAAFSLADIGSLLLTGGEALAARVLALPGELDGVKWHPFLAAGRCVFHDSSCGCTLPREQMPLQCRTYLCAPDRLLPAAQLAEYEPYVDALEEQEAFVEEHMRLESGADFHSAPAAVKEAARKAFDAWRAGTGG